MQVAAKLSAGLVIGAAVYNIFVRSKRTDASLQAKILAELDQREQERGANIQMGSHASETIVARGREEATPLRPERISRFRTDSFAEVNGDQEDTKPLYIFVLTGGPCAGKTTAMARVSTFFRQRGFKVYTVPEAATIMMSNGATFQDLDTDEKELIFQQNLLQTQMNLEDLFVSMGRNTTDKPCILLCDRGTMDGRAYIPPDTWNRLMQRCGYDYINLRDRRYNAVFHLVTAANGAEKYYQLENNVVRLETPEEARALDLKLQEAWVGHSNLIVFDNSTSFEDKLQRLIAKTSQLVGLPEALGAKKQFRKFLMKPGDLPVVPVNSETFEVEKVYLRKEGLDGKNGYCFMRKRAQGSLCNYGLTTVTIDAKGSKIETKRIIRGREYATNYASLADPSRKIVRQKRICFLYDQLYYEIYHYTGEGITVLNCQIEGDGDVTLPPFVEVLKDVTDDPEYSAYYLSLKNRPSLAACGSPSGH